MILSLFLFDIYWYPLVDITPSVLGRFLTTRLGCDYMILLIIGRVYVGQKITGQNLYYFHPHMSF